MADHLWTASSTFVMHPAEAQRVYMTMVNKGGRLLHPLWDENYYALQSTGYGCIRCDRGLVNAWGTECVEPDPDEPELDLPWEKK